MIGLVWRVQPVFTVVLGVLYILQGFVPALTAYVNAALLSEVVHAIAVRGGDGTTYLACRGTVRRAGIG